MKWAFGGVHPFGYGALRVLRNLAIITGMTTGAAMADEVVIVAMGDSLTQGYGLPNGEGFVPKLDAWLAAAGLSVDLINAGVSGDTTAGGLSRAAWTLTDDVDGMILALGGNDYLRGIDPAVSRANLAGILDEAQAREVPVLLVGLRVGANYGPAYQDAFQTMYPELAEAYGAQYVPEFFEGLREASEASELNTFMQADGIHPNAAGVDKIVAAMGPAMRDFAASLTQ